MASATPEAFSTPPLRSRVRELEKALAAETKRHELTQREREVQHTHVAARRTRRRARAANAIAANAAALSVALARVGREQQKG